MNSNPTNVDLKDNNLDYKESGDLKPLPDTINVAEELAKTDKIKQETYALF